MEQSSKSILSPIVLLILAACFFAQDGFVLQENLLSFKQAQQQQQQQQKRNASAFAISHQQTKNIPKPQLKFTDKVNNSSQLPFIPKLRTKPNAQTPLPSNGELQKHLFSKRFSLSLSLFSGIFKSRRSISESGSPGETSRCVSESFCRPGSNQSSLSPRLLHPYFDEIEAFEPAEHLLKEVEPQVRTKRSDEVRRLSDEFLSIKVPKPIGETKCSFVDTIDKLQTMMNHIEMRSELAVDLEVRLLCTDD